MVKLDGEAYFAVAKDAAHPFIVQTDNMETRVLGTKFNVCGFQGKDTRITLIEGSVIATNRKTRQQVKMLPGEEVVVTAEGKTQKNSVKDGLKYGKILRKLLKMLGIILLNQYSIHYVMH